MKIGIIGLGRIGKVHLDAIQRIPAFNVHAISDIDEDLCKRISAENHIPRYSVDYKDIVTDKDIDAVWICSPSKLHYDQVSLALQQGKYVFCEKPLETNLEKTKTLIERFPEIDEKLMVGFNRRFDPEFAYAKKIAHTVGRPTVLRIVSRDPAPPPISYLKGSGGIFIDMAIHDFDMARYLIGEEVTEVFATGSVNHIEEIKDFDVDTSLAILKFNNGAICSIDNARVCSYGYDQRLELHGNSGTVQVGNKRVHECSVFTENQVSTSILPNSFLERYKEAYIQEALVFYNCIRNKKKFTATAYDALKALELALACQKSLKENRVVQLSEMTT